MITSQIQAVLPYNIKSVWQAVTDVKNYRWRSDLSHTEVLSSPNMPKTARPPILQPLFFSHITVGNLHLKTIASAAAGAEFLLNRKPLPL